MRFSATNPPVVCCWCNIDWITNWPGLINGNCEWEILEIGWACIPGNSDGYSLSVALWRLSIIYSLNQDLVEQIQRKDSFIEEWTNNIVTNTCICIPIINGKRLVRSIKFFPKYKPQLTLYVVVRSGSSLRDFFRERTQVSGSTWKYSTDLVSPMMEQVILDC